MYVHVYNRPSSSNRGGSQEPGSPTQASVLDPVICINTMAAIFPASGWPGGLVCSYYYVSVVYSVDPHPANVGAGWTHAHPGRNRVGKWAPPHCININGLQSKF